MPRAHGAQERTSVAAEGTQLEVRTHPLPFPVAATRKHLSLCPR
jgi:hypothetical protein